MLKSLRNVIVVGFIFFLQIVFAQEPVSIHLTENEGLPDVEFYDLLEDKEGFIWLAADKGLYRYDGKTYLNFSTENKRGLSVFNLQLDDKGRVWCNNISGQFFYIENNQMHLFVDIKERVNHLVPRFIITKDHLEIVTDRGYYRAHLVDKTITEVEREREDNKDTPVYDIYNFNNSLFYATTRIYKITQNKTILKKINENKNSTRFFKLQNDLLIHVNYAALHKQDRKTKFFRYDNTSFIEVQFPKELQNKKINRIVSVDKQIWFCTNKGVIICTLNKNKLVFQNHLFSSESITKVIKDKDHNYWFSTLDNGLFIVSNLEVNRQKLPKDFLYITTMIKVGDQIIYGTKRGLIVVKNTNTEAFFNVDLNFNREITKLVYFKKKNLILISQELRSYIWDLNSNVIQQYVGFSSAKDIKIVNSKDVLFSGSKESYIIKNVIPKSSFKISEIRKPKLRSNSTQKTSLKKIQLRTRRSYANFSSSEEKIFVSYVDGVFVTDSLGTNSKEIKLNNASIFGINFTETDDGIVWISTFKNGVLGVLNDSIVHRYTTENGLLSNQISRIKADKNNLWVVNDMSLQFVDRENNAVKNVSVKDELSLVKISSVLVGDEELFVAGNNGIVSFDKKKVFKQSQAPLLNITAVKIKGKNVGLKSWYQLKYRNNNIDFHFNSNGFKSNDNIEYHYRLKDLENEWKTTNSTSVRYPSIPNGNYVFEIKAVHKSSLAESEIKSLRVKVIAPFWMQWWFYLIVIIILSHFYVVRLNQVKQKQQEQLEKEKLDKSLVLSQLENLRSQMNPHFIFNALNSIQEFIITSDKYSASIYLSDFSKLIRKYLDQSRKIEVSLKEEIETLKIYLELEKLRFNNQFEYSIEFDKDLDLTKTYLPSLFLQPYIENAIKHGLLHKKENRVLQLIFSLDASNKQLVCVIEDNGIGREASHIINQKASGYHTSFSTSATNDRISLLNKDTDRKISCNIVDLTNEDRQPLGTKVVLKIPI